jgi:predicted DNA-binding protein (UPF0278 family)
MSMEDQTQPQQPDEMSREEIIRKLNESTEKMMASLQKAYHAGLKEGLSDQEEDRLMELLQKAKELRAHIEKITAEDPSGGTAAEPA